MRLISFSVTISLALLSSASLAQQSPGTTGDTIGHPPPLAGPPPISEPPTTKPPAPAASTPRASEPASKGDTYLPALPEVDTGPGRDVVGPDGSTKTVKAVPCSTYAQETDGTTTCVGIPEGGAKTKDRR
jgi:hypothetical protein